jgi:hypothetical protein
MVVDVIKRNIDGGWWYGMAASGAKGYFPGAFVKVMNAQHSTAAAQLQWEVRDRLLRAAAASSSLGVRECMGPAAACARCCG